MHPGDLIKHRKNDSTAVVVDISVDKDDRDPEHDREWATVLFTGDGRPSTVPFKLIKENWEVIDGKT